MRILSILAGALLALAGPSAAQAQVQVYPSSGQRHQAGDSLHLVGSADRTIDFMLVPDGSTGALEVVLTPFSSELAGTTARFVDASGSAVGSTTSVDFGGDVPQVLHVRFDSLPGPQPFAGALVIGPGTDGERAVTVVIESAAGRRTATLVIDVPEVVRDVVVSPFGRTSVDVPVTVSERDSAWPVYGFLARAEEVTASSATSFDPRTAMTFFDGDTLLPLWSSASDDPRRDLAPGDVRTLRARVKVSQPGEHRAKIRFTGANVLDDDDQILDLTVRARHPMWTVILVLGLGVIVSLVVTKVLSVARQQLVYRAGLQNLPIGFLRSEPPTMAAVRVLAMVRRAQALATGFLLSWRDLVAEPLEREKRRMECLRRVARLRRDIESWMEPATVKRRATKHLRSVMRELAEEIDDALVERVSKDLDGLEEWNDEKLRLDHFAESLEGDITTLLGVAEPGSLDPGVARTRMEALERHLVDVADDSLPRDWKTLIELEKSYARLKILWEWHEEPSVLEDLTVSSEGPMKAFFDEADAKAWEELGEVEVRPRGSSQPVTVESFEPIVFDVVPQQDGRGENYLFKHNLIFEWRLELQPPRWKLWRRSRKLVLTPKTNEPRVVQYAPRPGTLKASVTLRYKNDTKDPVDGPEVKVGGSWTKRLLRAFSRIEGITTGVALVAAVVSGVLMFYVDNPTFGSTKDYLTVLLWALAIEQSKNFLQIDQTLRERSGG